MRSNTGRTGRLTTRLATSAAVGLLGACAASSHASLAKLQGGSGYSGTLSSNAGIRKQQLICDPAVGTEGPAPVNSPLAQGAPRRGSTSTSYDPSMVTLSGLDMGTGYAGSGVVQVDTGEGGLVLQDIVDFLNQPAGVETGYVQVFYHHGPLASGVEFPMDDVFGPAGEPGQTPVAGGFTTFDAAGVSGFDTHTLFFTYKAGVSDKAVAEYNMFADTGTHDNAADSVTGLVNGNTFTLGPGQLASATVRASLVPLPPAVWAGSATLAGLGLIAAARRRAVAR
jgi:hypothetical protein